VVPPPREDPGQIRPCWEPDQERKVVRFSTIVHCLLVPTRSEYQRDAIWWSQVDYFNFRVASIEDESIEG